MKYEAKKKPQKVQYKKAGELQCSLKQTETLFEPKVHSVMLFVAAIPMNQLRTRKGH